MYGLLFQKIPRLYRSKVWWFCSTCLNKGVCKVIQGTPSAGSGRIIHHYPCLEGIAPLIQNTKKKDILQWRTRDSVNQKYHLGPK